MGKKKQGKKETSEVQRIKVWVLHKKGELERAIASATGIPKSTVHKIIQRKKTTGTML